MTVAYLSLGSNVGDRVQNIAHAIDALPLDGVRVARRSALYETEPVEFRDQDWFLNCVVEVETGMMPEELMRTLLKIERSMGRERLVPKGPRVIDIDILLYGSLVVDGPQLQLPHPRMTDRRFVLVPFAELAPEAVHPVLRKTIRQLLDQTEDRSEVRKA
jgi:2-amino-4-hydroxy-6-hydroxymethyldihydropteridine diphosphokinase